MIAGSDINSDILLVVVSGCNETAVDYYVTKVSCLILFCIRNDGFCITNDDICII